MGVIDHYQQPNLQFNQEVCTNSKGTRIAVSWRDAQAAFKDNFVSIAPFNDDVDSTGAELEQEPWLDVGLMVETFLVQFEVGKQGGHPSGACGLMDTRFRHGNQGVAHRWMKMFGSGREHDLVGSTRTTMTLEAPGARLATAEEISDD